MTYAATKKLVDDLRRDARRYADFGGPLGNLGFWAGATYRAGVWSRRLPRLARFLVAIPQRIADGVWRVAFNLRISPDASIGPGLCLIHPWSVIIGACEIGEDCLIFHEVTLGTNANSEGAFPTIGDRVDIYVGARVLGKVRVGDGVKIGANAVVIRSVPDGTTVAPPRVRMISAAAVHAFGARARGSAE